MLACSGKEQIYCCRWIFRTLHSEHVNILDPLFVDGPGRTNNPNDVISIRVTEFRDRQSVANWN